MKTITDVTEFTKNNVEAFVASAKAAQAGAQTLTSAVVENSRKGFEDAQAAFQALAAVKSPTELLQVQNDFAKAQFDQAISSWSRISETWLKVAGEVAQPLSNRVAVASETVSKPVNA